MGTLVRSAHASARPHEAVGPDVRDEPARTTVRHLHEIGESPAQALWARLAERAIEPNPFFESWFLLPSLRALDPAGAVRILVIEQNGEWLGLLPIVPAARYYGRPLPHWST